MTSADWISIVGIGKGISWKMDKTGMYMDAGRDGVWNIL
jgi:hypothetical protein